MLVTSIFSFPTMFSTLSKTEIIIYVTFILSSANAFNLDLVIFLSSGNGIIATFQLSSAASLNLGQSQNGVLGNGLKGFFKKKNMFSSL